MKIAMFIDSENCLDKKINKHLLYECISKYGDLCIKKIYCDWKESYLHDHWNSFVVEYGFDEIQVKKINGKNSIDNKIIVDAVELLFTKHFIDCYILLGSDRDYISLISKIIEMGKKCYIIGDRQSTNYSVIQKCSQFIYVEQFKSIHTNENEIYTKNDEKKEKNINHKKDQNINYKKDQNIKDQNIKEFIIHSFKKGASKYILLSTLKKKLQRIHFDYGTDLELFFMTECYDFLYVYKDKNDDKMKVEMI
jgi:uncharacterized protein (TIGR00288 family)